MLFSAFSFEIALSETCRDMEIEEDTQSLGNTMKIFCSSKHSHRRYPIDSFSWSIRQSEDFQPLWGVSFEKQNPLGPGGCVAHRN